MSKEIRDFLIDMAIVAVVLVITLPFAIKSCEPKVDEVVECDTIYVHDTIRIVEPKIVKEEVVRYDTVYVLEKSVLGTQDSLNVPESGEMGTQVVLPITQRVYEDSTYKAWVSGYDPRLDSLHLYRKEVYYPVMIKQTVKPRVVVSAGVYGGFGAKGVDYGLGISVGVPIWSW